MIRVLHVVTYMGRGGLETMLMNYYRNIDKSQVQFDFLVHRDFEADYDKEIESLGGRIYRLPRLNPFSSIYKTKLDQFFEEHKAEYKIVHSHLDCLAGIPLKYAKKYGIPVRIAHAHSSNQTKDKKYLLKLLFKKNITKYANELVACGNEAGLWMFETDKFHILNNAIDSSKYKYDFNLSQEIKNKWNIAEDVMVVGHVGRFNEPKNHKFIVEVFQEVLNEQDNAVLLLVGAGELKPQIEKQVKGAGIEKNVIFTGLCSEVEKMLQVMNVFLFPSIYEGLPVSIVEAQAAGLPCLISDKVPIECKKTKLVHQLELSKSSEEWAKKVIELSKIEKCDTSEEIKAAKFDISENAKELQTYYLDICNRRKC